MSGTSHWRAEDYEWDPHNLQSKRRGSNDAAVLSKHAEDRSARGLRSQKGQDVKGSAADTSPTIVSGDDTSHMQTSGGEPSRGGVSVVTLSGDGTPPDDSGDAPTSARRNVPVLNDAYLNPRGTHKKRIPMQCQIDGCQKDLSKEKEYYQRYRICETHLKLSSLIKDGVPQRFCQQCGRFHILADFDSDKRSCRARLNLHNDRRRKRNPSAQETPRQELSAVELRSRRTRTRRKSRAPNDEGSDATGSGDLPVKAETETGSIRSRLSREGQEQAERPLQYQESNHLPELDPTKYPHFSPYQSVSFIDNQQIRYPPEVDASLQGFAYGIGGIFDTELRRSFESPNELRSADDPIGSIIPQSVQSNLESGSPISLHLASQLTGDPSQQRNTRTSYGPNRHYLLESTESLSGQPPPVQLRTVPAQNYRFSDSAPLPSDWSTGEGRTSSMLSHQDVARTSTSVSHSQGQGSAGSGQHVPGFSLRYGSGSTTSASSPSSVRRVEPGSTRFSGLTYGRQRLTASAPEQMSIPEIPPGSLQYPVFPGAGFPIIGHPRHSDPGIMGPQFTEYEEALNTGYRPHRWSDPGNWTQHYSGMQRDARLLSSQGSTDINTDRTRIMRSAVKMDVRPDAIPSDMRDAYLQLTNSSPAGHMEAAMRPGCTQLIATCLSQGAQPSALEGLARLVKSNDVFWSSTEVLIQHTESTAQMKEGRVTGFWADHLHRSLQPPKPQTKARVVQPGGGLTVTHTREHSHSVPPMRILARCNGIFLNDMQVDVETSRMELPEVESDGVLWLETENNGLLSDPTAIVLCRDLDIVEDLQRIEDSVLLTQMPEEEVESILVDIGMVLQYRSIMDPDNLTDLDIGASQMLPSCCHISLPSSADQGDQGRMSGNLYLRYICKAARRLLALCCREGWPHLANRVLPVAAIGLLAWAEVTESVESFLGHQMLLHALLSSASKAMLILILDLFVVFQVPVDFSGKVNGMTALHVAASLPDGGDMADAILERCPAAKSMWNSVRNKQGQSPADVAYIAYQRLTAAGRESEDAIAMLCEKTEVLNSPPPTPRVAEAPNQSHRRIIPASALPALKSHWLKFSSPANKSQDLEEMEDRQVGDDSESSQPEVEAKPRPDTLSMEDTAMEDLHEASSDGHAHVSSPSTNPPETLYVSWKHAQSITSCRKSFTRHQGKSQQSKRISPSKGQILNGTDNEDCTTTEIDNPHQ